MLICLMGKGRKLFIDKKGQGLVEYALIIALVAVALVVGLVSLNTGLSTSLTNSLNGLTSALGL